MKNNNFLKGLIMTIVAFIASYITDNQEAGIQWQYLLISTFGISIIYLGKNWVLPSNSEKNKLSIIGRDGLSGLIIAIGTALSTGAASFIVNDKIDLKSIGTAVIAVVVGYFAKTFKSDLGKLK